LLNLMMKSLYCLGLIQNSQGLVWTCSMLRGATKFFVICHFFAFQILFSTMLSKSGWWYTYPSEKYEFVSWDDESPNIMESHKIHVPNHQSQIVSITYYCYYSYKPTWLMHCK
jgi:hypothetical protein